MGWDQPFDNGEVSLNLNLKVYGDTEGDGIWRTTNGRSRQSKVNHNFVDE